jgi:enoyl-CoA hydratase/carnithine racemase
MHDSHAAQAARLGLVQEIADHGPGLDSIQPMQVELVFDAPATAAQLAQDLRRVTVA